MSDKTLIEWNADVGTRFLTIYPDGSFHINENTPPLYALGELAKAFMRQQDRIKRLEEVTNDPHALWANWLRGDVKLPVGIGDVRQYQDRIKRLEEAGDAMALHAQLGGIPLDHIGWVNAWREAKEAKL